MSGTFEQRSIYSGPIRRALEELQRRLTEGGQGEPGPPGPPGLVQGIVAGANVTVDSTNPAYPIVSATGGGSGTGTDEVWVGTDDPIGANPSIELWFDSDAPAPGDGLLLGYEHIQGTATDTWMIYHPLSFTPGVSVVDSAGDEVEGDVTYQAPGVVMVRFSAAFSGRAYLS